MIHFKINNKPIKKTKSKILIIKRNKNKKETQISKKDGRRSFKFEWKKGGNKVTIRGSFLSNWIVIIGMIKNYELKF